MADKADKNDIPDLGELRKSIDGIDKKIVDLLNQRAEVSLGVGRYKAAKGEAIYKPFREQEVMDKIADSSPGPLPDKHLRTIYREIMSSSRHLQRPERVVYLGPEGTFSYFAALEHMGSAASLTPKSNFEDIFRAVAEEGAELGVIPLENSIEGTVGQVVDLFMKYKVYIQAEVFSRISHSLISMPTRWRTWRSFTPTRNRSANAGTGCGTTCATCRPSPWNPRPRPPKWSPGKKPLPWSGTSNWRTCTA